MHPLALIPAVLLALAHPAAAACDPPVAVRFAAGASSAELAGGIPRGSLDCFTVTARSGQHLAVSQRPAAGPSNIVMQIYKPGWKITRTDDGPEIAAHALPGAGEGEDAKSWYGRLPASGTYLLVIGTTRGGGEYKVKVEIH
ncbi:hypothetical protein CCS01_20810 [Rhodopila globiformis]|uniref:Peptidase C-terminal archaeal/bacterial domain-containing protein n=2 Tax=Rhodopila globiformis TaxID=1071 RepID=A0A2S6N4Z7_RHOGL|nr:hypothetical protein CCS01_20810 [Rhodopila globiformis]